MNPYDSIEIKIPKLTEKLTSVDELLKHIQNLKENEEQEDNEDEEDEEEEPAINRYFIKENSVNKELDTYVKSLGVPTLNFLERWRDIYIPDNSK